MVSFPWFLHTSYDFEEDDVLNKLKSADIKRNTKNLIEIPVYRSDKRIGFL